MQPASHDEAADSDREAAAPPMALHRWLPVWLTPRVATWATYDIASSTYFTVVPPVLFPIYFATVVSPAGGIFFWGLTVSIALVVAGFAAPFVGSLADRMHRRWLLLMPLTLLCCLAVAALGLVGPGDVLAAIVVFATAQAAYVLATLVYESYLPFVATKGTAGRVSTFGWAVGFIGCIVTIFIVLPLAGGGTGPDSVDLYRTSFPVIGGIYLALAIPAVLALRRVATKPNGVARTTVSSVLHTLKNWRDHRETFKLILAFYLINDAVVTVTVFTAPYFSTHFGSSVEDLLLLLLIYTLIAMPATLVFGVIADRWSHRGAIGILLAILVAAVCLLAFGTGPWVPTVVVVLLGFAIGSISAVFRSLLAQVIPREQAAEFFGFNSLAGRVSAALGPLVYGGISLATGNQQAGLLSLLPFFAAGAIVLTRVRIPPHRPAPRPGTMWTRRTKRHV